MLPKGARAGDGRPGYGAELRSPPPPAPQPGTPAGGVYLVGRAAVEDPSGQSWRRPPGLGHFVGGRPVPATTATGELL